MADRLDDIFPEEPTLSLDEKRSLRLRVKGLQYLDREYGSTSDVLKALTALQQGEGQSYVDLPRFLYACLMDKNGNSPLAMEQIEALIEDGANLTDWLIAISKAVSYFFRRRTSGRAAGAPGPGSGPIG